jgi:hypothetical protein
MSPAQKLCMCEHGVALLMSKMCVHSQALLCIQIVSVVYFTTLFHHHHMALQPKSGPGLPFWGFVTITFLRGCIVSPAPNLQPGGPGLCIYDPRAQGGPAVPPGTGYPF